ncbi:unnamed protein product [Mycena citricolor]|uniref:GATA-type domain-containing protein n=1 Tax=Mycena citricolor TaxID=2018698 RepID=A0AAD2HXI2_9AGAR|nr:unnamed protein product [Mycena citricolor]
MSSILEHPPLRAVDEFLPSGPALLPQSATNAIAAAVASSAPAVPVRPTCVNCGTLETPLWRRTPEGSPICNACGLYQKSRGAPRPAPAHANSANAAPAVPSVPLTPAPVAGHGGTCPGDGRCDGTGGSSACSGCPTWNNALGGTNGSEDKSEPTDATLRNILNPTPPPSTPVQEVQILSATHPDAIGGQTSPTPSTPKINALACGNCGTSTTPLWRRDDVGNNICNACGLYFKLHGTHRPTSMKKTVIKRRKRVPAAGAGETSPGGNAMSDQAAAEALVAVGRSRPSPHPHPTDDETDADAPKRKRARRKTTTTGTVSTDDEARGKDRAKWFPNVELPYTPYASAYGSGDGNGSVPPSRGGAGSPVNGTYHRPPPVPTLDELERHYFNLHEQRRQMESILRETDRMMTGLKRGLDEMRAGVISASEGAVDVVPLRGRSRESSANAGASVWPVTPAAAIESHPDRLGKARYEHLLTTNDTPEEDEISRARAAIGYHRTRLNSLEERVTALRAEMEPLETERTAVETALCQNIGLVCPLRRLPTETLLEIFAWTLPSVTYPLNGRLSFNVADSPWVLGHVCRRWRIASISSPALWSLFAFDYRGFISNEVLPRPAGDPISYYAGPMVALQLQRAQKIQVHFYGSEDLDPAPQVAMFAFLAQHVGRWEELSIGLTAALFPYLAALQGRFPALQRLWVDWDTGSSQEGVTSLHSFAEAPALRDAGFYNEFRMIPMSFPTRNLTRYRMDAPWSTHRDILITAKNLREAYVEISFDNPLVLIDDSDKDVIQVSLLERLCIGHPGILNFLRAPLLYGLAFFFECYDWVDADICVDAFVKRSACTLKHLSLKGVPEVPIFMRILSRHPSVTEIAISFFDLDFGDAEICDTLIAELSANVSPQLSRISFGYADAEFSNPRLFLMMLRSRFGVTELRAAGLLAYGSLNMTPDDQAGFRVLMEAGLEFLTVEGQQASDIMAAWMYIEQWN